MYVVLPNVMISFHFSHRGCKAYSQSVRAENSVRILTDRLFSLRFLQHSKSDIPSRPIAYSFFVLLDHTVASGGVSILPWREHGRGH